MPDGEPGAPRAGAVGRVTTAYWILLLSAIVVYFAFPSTRLVSGILGWMTSVAAMAVGIRLYRPRRAASWWLLALSVFLLGAGNSSYVVVTEVLGRERIVPSVPDLCYLGMNVVLVAALLSLPRLGTTRRDRAGILDALIVTTIVGLLAWAYLIGPYLRTGDAVALERTLSFAYPLYDVLVLAAGASLLAGVRRTVSARLMAAGWTALLVGDVVYALDELYGSWAVGGPSDLTWIAFYATWGAAALHPSMASLTEPRVSRPGGVRTRRALAALGAALLVVPAVLLGEAVTGGVRGGAVLAVAFVVIGALVVARMTGVLRGHRRAVAQSRVLSQAAEELAAATDAEEVAAAVRRAVAGLLPAGTPHRVLLVREPDPEVAGPGPSGGGATIGYVCTLAPELAAELAEFELALACRLDVEPRQVGVMLIVGDDRALMVLRQAAEMLAAFASNALRAVDI